MNNDTLTRELESSEFLQNFDKDRNILLKKAQEGLFNFLAGYMIKKSFDKYKVLFNPLGLVDSTFQRILDYDYEDKSDLSGIYENLCVIYRYKHGDNQLEIMWDGRTHEEVYREQWTEVFDKWIDDLTNNTTFIKGILHLTALKEPGSNPVFIRNYVKSVINNHFEIKVLKRNGVKRVVVKEKKVQLKKAS
ncbi:hypothetical protein [Reichenbachiella versicolor]|uniref:hypothetical protein n=1 Tax=Reichenbachiella versicolor TaxID=1821036 RepID=UPI000D6E7BA9|nr:hypothetical protein [Reichenbachiella versicolor]